MSERDEALRALCVAALAWHDVEFGAPGEVMAALELSAVLNSYRPALVAYLADVAPDADADAPHAAQEAQHDRTA